MNENRRKIREFFARFFPTDGIRDTDDIFAQGCVNSLFAMQLIQWLETEFPLEIKDEDLELANFNSVSAIANFIERKQLTLAVA